LVVVLILLIAPMIMIAADRLHDDGFDARECQRYDPDAIGPMGRGQLCGDDNVPPPFH
jgi:uncharacterized membrane protein YhaH (DUF805 family)